MQQLGAYEIFHALATAKHWPFVSADVTKFYANPAALSLAPNASCLEDFLDTLALDDHAQNGWHESESKKHNVFWWIADSNKTLLLIPKREQLASQISHELANGMTAILGWSQLARRNASPEMDESLALIERVARHTTTLSRALTNPERPKNASTSVCDTLADIAQLLLPQAAKRSARVSTSFSADANAAILPAELHAMVWNLAYNAVSMIEPGGEVSLGMSTSVDKVQIYVTDNGPGMDERTRDSILLPNVTYRDGGSGLGLALVSELVEKWQGTLRVESEEGRGSRFIITLPTTAQTTRDHSGIQAVQHSLQGQRILIIDNDIALREMLELGLAIHGANVHGCSHHDTIEGTYDIALVDLNLGDARGDDVIANLRQRNITQNAIMISGEAAQAMSEAGTPNAWLQKPFESSEAIARIRDVLQLSNNDNTLSRHDVTEPSISLKFVPGG